MAHRRPQGSAEFIRDRRSRPPTSPRGRVFSGSGRCTSDPTNRVLATFSFDDFFLKDRCALPDQISLIPSFRWRTLSLAVRYGDSANKNEIMIFVYRVTTYNCPHDVLPFGLALVSRRLPHCEEQGRSKACQRVLRGRAGTAICGGLAHTAMRHGVSAVSRGLLIT